MDKKNLENFQTEVCDAKPSKSVHYLVTGLIAIILLLVLTMAVGGSLFILKHSNGERKEIIPNYTDNKDIRNKGGYENIQIDRVKRIEKFTQKDEHSELSSVAVLDYYSRLTSIYMKELDTCFLIGGIFNEIGSFEKSLQVINNKTQTDTEVKLRYAKEADQVLNYDLLTTDMKTYCSRSNGLYWLHEIMDSHPLEAHKTKRKVKIGLNIRIGPIRISVSVEF